MEHHMQYPDLTLISHHLCPFVQRSVIVLLEKNIPHQRRYIDLAAKPDWFLRLSPTGKVPILLVDDKHVLFESAVICEYLNDITPGDLHASDPLTKARHRAWIEFGSGLLMDIAGLYSAADQSTFMQKAEVLAQKWQQLEPQVQGPYFNSAEFNMVDAAYAPIFRYFDVLDAHLPRDLFADLPGVRQWRLALSQRPSARSAVSPDYPDRLRQFLINRDRYLSSLLVADVCAD